MPPKRAPRVDHWPPALQSAAALTGTLVRSGPGYRPVSWPDTSFTRCNAIGGLLTQRYAAVEETASWIWGASRSPGSPLRLITRHGRAPARFETATSEVSIHISNYRLQPGDLVEIGEYYLTSRSRTAYDLLRSTAPLTRPRAVACRLLLLAEPGASSRVARRAMHSSRADRARVRARLLALRYPVAASTD